VLDNEVVEFLELVKHAHKVMYGPNVDTATAGSYIDAGNRPSLFCVSCSFSIIPSPSLG
jgi:hypothetical protein